MKQVLIPLALAFAAVTVQAKLPAPSDEAKAKAAEAAAKAAHGNKVAAYKLCRANERVAEHYRAEAKKAGKEPGATVDTPACADPGAYSAAAPAAVASAAKKP